MSDSKRVVTAEEFRKMFERKPDKELWTRIQKKAKGNEAQKCEAVRAILTNFYKTPKEADELVKQLATESSTVRVEIAKLLQEGQKHFSSGLYHELLNILRKDDDPFVKKVVAEENKRWIELMKPMSSAIEATRNISVSISKMINGVMRSIPTIPYLPRPRWEEEREKLLSYISILENQLRKEQKEKQRLLQIIKEFRKRLQKKIEYIA